MTRFGLKLRRRLVKNSFDDAKITEFTVYSDLVIRKGRTRLEEVGVEDQKIYKTIPKKCPKCGHETMISMTVLGTDDSDNLFWMCDSCEELLLTRDKVETEILLEKCSKCWTNPNDWGTREGELN